MEIKVKTRNKKDFKAGDIVTLKEERNYYRTGKTNYYLVGLLDDGLYCLININTGKIGETLGGSSRYIEHWDFDNSIDYYNKEDLITLIKRHDGKVYSGDKAKLLLEKNN